MNNTNQPSAVEAGDGFKVLFTKYPFVTWLVIGLIFTQIPSLEWIFAVCLILGICLSIRNRNSKHIEKYNQQKAIIIEDAQNFIEQVKQRKSLVPIQSSLVVGHKEHVFLEEDTLLRETRSVRNFQSTGLRVRVMKGLSLGHSRGKAESHKEWRMLDEGKLIVTNKKLVFDGPKEDRTVPLDKLLNVSPTIDGIEISSSTRSGSMIFPVSNPFIWAATIRILSSVSDPLDLGGLNLDIQFK